MLAEAYLHDLDPYAIKLWDGGPIRWYGLSYVAAFLVGYLIIRRVARVGQGPLVPDRVGDLIVALIFGVLLGGRLGYALFYKPSLFTSFSGSLPFWDLLAVNKGGMASHGGLIGVVLASLWFARRHDIRWTYVLDLATFAGSIGLFFGRVGNFLNGELYGRRCDESFPLAMKFPQEISTWSAEALQELATPLRAIFCGQRDPADLAFWVIERVQHGNRQVIAIVRPMLTPRHPSQLYEAVLEGLVLFGILALLWIKPRKPGVIFGACCVTYSALRIVVEFFREADAGIGYTTFGPLAVTRGQWLSAIMCVAGVVVVSVCRRRPTPLMGGWWGRK